ncbi:hypothetical protein D3C72_1663440 [compost metagenome]
MPNAGALTMKRLARWLVLLMAIPVMIVASQGYSVLYLFLLADLLCSAAAFPVFYGLFSRKHDGFTATASTVAGLVAGLFFFPAPGDKPTYLLESFLLAALVPVATTVLIRCLRRRRKEFDFSTLSAAVRRLDRETV